MVPGNLIRRSEHSRLPYDSEFFEHPKHSVDESLL
jgi:hypothetical protein